MDKISGLVRGVAGLIRHTSGLSGGHIPELIWHARAK